MEGLIDKILSIAAGDISVCFFANGVRICETTPEMSHTFRVLCAVTLCGPDQLDKAQELLDDAPQEDEETDYYERYKALRAKVASKCQDLQVPESFPSYRNDYVMAVRELRKFVQDNYRKFQEDVLVHFPEHSMVFCDANYHARVDKIKILVDTEMAFENDYIFMMEYIDDDDDKFKTFHKVHNLEHKLPEIDFIVQHLSE